MKHPALLRSLALCFALSLVLSARASDADAIAAVRAADDERVAATVAADAARLDAIYSDQLHYAHSNGVIDTKASFVESLTSGRSDYLAIDYVQRDFTPAGPGIVLMKGRAVVRLGSAEGTRLIDLNFLSVWREEGGKWRFLAWQSCRNPAANPAPATK